MFGRYHVTEPKRFYDGSSKWLVSPDPGSGVIASSEITALASGANAAANSSNAPQSATSTGKRIDPFYLNIKLPGQDEHFIILSPFVPVSSGNSQTRLVSFLTANSDPEQYGQLQAYVMPTGQNVDGPVQVNNAILRTAAVSTAITFLNQQGSSVIQGSMQLIPVGNSIVYVRPFYAQSRQQGSFPQFQFVVVYSQGSGNAFCGQTVEDGLNQLLKLTTATTQSCLSNATTGDTGSDTTPTTTTDHHSRHRHHDAGHDRADHHDGPADGRECAGAAEPGGGEARRGADGARGGQAR